MYREILILVTASTVITGQYVITKGGGGGYPVVAKGAQIIQQHQQPFTLYNNGFGNQHRGQHLMSIGGRILPVVKGAQITQQHQQPLTPHINGLGKHIKGSEFIVSYTFDNVKAKEVEDVSGNQRDGFIFGSVKFNKDVSEDCGDTVSFEHGGYIYFDDGRKQYGLDAITIAVWVRVMKTSPTNLIYQAFYDRHTYHYLEISNIRGIKPGSIAWQYMDYRGVVFNVVTEPCIEPGIWYHIAASFDIETAQVRIFKNGEKMYDGKANYVLRHMIPTGEITIGGEKEMLVDGSHISYFQGDMDMFNMYKIAVTEEDLQIMYDQCHFRREGQHLMSIGGRILPVAKGAQITQQHQQPLTPHINGLGKHIKGSEFIVSYTFDNVKAKEVEDVSGNQRDGFIFGSVKFNKDVSEDCGDTVSFGHGGYIYFDDGRKQYGLDAITIAVWVRVIKTSPTNLIYQAFYDRHTYHYLEISNIRGIKPGSIAWQYMDYRGVVFNVVTEPCIEPGIWYHIAASFDIETAQVRIFKNGEKMYDGKANYVLRHMIPTGEITIGGEKEMLVDGSHISYFQGDMDMFNMYKIAVTEEDLQIMYDQCHFRREGQHLMSKGGRILPVVKGAQITKQHKQPLTPHINGLRKQSRESLFLVTVYTADKIRATTSGEIFITIFGEDGETRELHLSGAGKHRGKSDIYDFYEKNIGNLKKIHVQFDGHILSNWKLDKITVVVGDRTNGMLFEFPCDCTFSRERDQRMIDAKENVNGGWSSWSAWSGCGSGLCGGGKKVRTRSCTNPEPIGGGKECEGESYKQEQCGVDGGWGAWSPWLPCTKTCGGSVVSRTRECNNPEPKGNGTLCDEYGARQTKIDCTFPCETAPLDGQWSEWSPWSACAKTCGGGLVTRTRKCNKPAPAQDGKKCPGDEKESAMDCLNSCPIDGGWAEWGEWSRCSKTCGKGTMTRSRKCDNPEPDYGGKDCGDSSLESRRCKIRSCLNAVNGNWGDWGEFGECSEKFYCHKGHKTRKRECNNPSPREGGDPCPGTNTEKLECPTQNCIDVPQNREASKKIPQNSELYAECSSDTAFLVENAKNENSMDPILNTYFKGIQNVLRSGYFAKARVRVQETDLTKFCFEPAIMLMVGQLKQSFPKYAELPVPPSYQRPRDTNHVQIISVFLRDDGSLYAGNFLLGTDDQYSSQKFTLDKPRFYFQYTPSNQRIFVHGFKVIARAKFELEVTGIKDKEFEATGTSRDSTLAAVLEVTMAKPSFGGADDKNEDDVETRQNGRLNEGDQVADGVLSAIQSSTISPLLASNKPVSLNRIIGISKKDTTEHPRTRGISGAFEFTNTDLGIKQFVFDVLKMIGLELIRVKDLAIDIHNKDGVFAIRVTGTAEPIALFHANINFEVIKNGVFAVGITADQADLEGLTEKIFRKRIHLFGKLRGPAIGFCFAQEGFDFTDTVVQFTREPLRTMKDDLVTDGLFVGFNAKLPEYQECKDSLMCKFAVKILGKNTNIQFYSFVKFSMAKVVGRIAKLPEGTNKGKFRLSKIELSMEIIYAAPNPTLGFTIELAIPVEGEIVKGTIVVSKNELYVGGTLNLQVPALTGELYMKGTWKKAFGIQFLTIKDIRVGVTINLATGIPQGFELQGTIEVGYDCFGPQAFSSSGHCIRAEASIGVDVNPLKGYVRAELSSLTLGVVFRLLGSKIQMPKVVDETGFPKGVTISVSLPDTTESYAGEDKKIKKGFYLKGMINIFGFSPSIEITISIKEISFKAELGKIHLPGGIIISRSLTDDNNGPVFMVRATRDPLNLEVNIHGAINLFGGKTDVQLKLAKEQIHAEFDFTLFSRLSTKVKLYANYTTKDALTEAGIEAHVTITSHLQDLAKKAVMYLNEKIEHGIKMLENGREEVRAAKEECIEKAEKMCQFCGKVSQSHIQEECEKGWNNFKHFVGSMVDKFGATVKRYARKIINVFTRSRTKRYIELLLYSGKRKGVELERRKRFVSKIICDKLLGKAVKISGDFCEGSCSIAVHIVKGMCNVLDVAQSALHSIEEDFSWAERAASYTADNMLLINKLSFGGKLTASFDAMQMLSVNLTLFEKDLNFDLKIDLKDIISSAEDLAMTALRKYIERYSLRFSKSSYDTPSEKSDYQLSGEMKIASVSNNECLAAVKDQPLYTDGCDKPTTVFAYTLTGAIMNIQSGLCLTFKGTSNSNPVQLDECSIDSVYQKFECTDMTFRPKITTYKCLSVGQDHQWGNLMSMEDNQVNLVNCNGNSNAQWKAHGDMAGVSVCERFVVDIALGKKAEQSSDKEEYGANRAIDGDMSSSLKDGSCILTETQRDPWWRVDLLKEYLVTDVSIVGESDNPDLELTSIEVRVGIDKQAFSKNPMCGARLREIQDGEVWTSQCWPHIAGQHVSVQKIGFGMLSMCEVAVFARLDKQGKCVDEVRRKRNEVALYNPGL